MRASTISMSPAMNEANIIARSLFVPAGAVLNSFQMNTPQSAATMVAPWPMP